MAKTTNEPPVRERLIDSAGALFYAEGIRAISADRIIAAVGTTKATFYRHFPTKDDLVLAYLEVRAELERSGVTAAAAASDPQEALRGVVGVLADTSCQPGFRGCPFINAGAEYADAAHPVRRLVAEQRTWWTTFFRTLAERLGVPSGAAADSAAAQILMLRDGALVAGYLDDPNAIQTQLSKAITAVVTSARADR
ncbi:TetR family transcriptional regulator [Kribbella sandramycini]|uniref:AcrR family transcriptional regulator n=1 Tax=Kribbella sandramycini TaxID=60450 RepID=A0A841S956_9ACTN|nr:AcrR family transcriptional regulator [Kribbella sandramycini]